VNFNGIKAGLLQNETVIGISSKAAAENQWPNKQILALEIGV
jgi:hypothetical protein